MTLRILFVLNFFMTAVERVENILKLRSFSDLRMLYGGVVSIKKSSYIYIYIYIYLATST